MDQIQTVAQLIERSREYHIPLVLVFVDYRNAFDSVKINALLNALVYAGVPSPLTNASWRMLLEHVNYYPVVPLEAYNSHRERNTAGRHDLPETIQRHFRMP
ncbi:unnamed protein product [Nippostrongylus brasiliensis]|uniref:Reverse transcriptase domain-containing protein n=1 Tax=Nippostrongylus brasiliensis TaxID=27835 RepID=A0A0N4XRD7_NIPBR|nr:unnamed protein product [Nippostrongylus brasiliensis]